MKKYMFMLLLLCMLLAAGCAGEGNTTDSTNAATEGTEAATEETVPHNTMTGEELMEDMKIGWNLGNTFDAPDGETSWGNPTTTKEMIEKLKELGFNTIRIPISWHKHVTPAPDFTIDETWMARVETVVNYALECDMYVIINSHHDNDIYLPTEENAETGKAYLAAIWTQIAQRFESADYRLIFQTMNEPRVVGKSYEWWVDTSNPECMASVEVVNQLNQAALDAIRATGGRNAERWVMVSPYAATPGCTLLDAFRLPEDPANKLILSIHAYTPYNLCLNANAPDAEFTVSHENEIRSFIRNVNYRYVKKGIPVIIDEMGCIDKDNPEARYEWAKSYVSIAKEYGMICCWWDNGLINQSGEQFGLLDRRNLEVYPDSQRVYEGLMAGLEETAE